MGRGGSHCRGGRGGGGERGGMDPGTIKLDSVTNSSDTIQPRVEYRVIGIDWTNMNSGNLIVSLFTFYY